MKVVVVYNPKSGSSLSRGDLRKKFAEHGIDIERFIKVDDNLEKNLRPVIKRKAYVAAIGGDGTLSAVAGLVVRSKATLIPLPGGTLNHFTKDLGVSQDLDQALAALKHAKPRMVDVGSVNDRIFINNSSIGLYPSSLRERERIEDALGKWPALVLASIRTLVRLPGFTVTIDKETFRTPFVFIGNNTYELSNFGAPVRTRLDEGALSIFIARKVSRFTLAKIALHALIGKADMLDDFEIRRAASVIIETAYPRPTVSWDGEVGHMDSPLHYAVQAGSLRVLAG